MLKGISEVLKCWYKGATEVLQRCYRVIQGCYRIVTWFYRGVTGVL